MPDAPRRRSASRASGAPPASDQEPARALSDGRVQMLVYLPPALIKAAKLAALENDTSASHVVEQALADWLARAAGATRRHRPAAALPAPAAPPPPTPALPSPPQDGRKRDRAKRP